MENNIRFVLGAAVVGIFLGVAGLVFGVVSKNKADELRREFSQVQELVEKIQRVEESSTGISASATRMARELDSLKRATQEGFDRVSNELVRFRSDLNATMVAAQTLDEKVSLLEQTRAPAVSRVASATAPAANTASSGTAEEGTWYVIRTGDTLSRVATTHQISLEALTTANPSIDPLRLQIGQRIRIPSR
jgi:LysM repeat protein